jgi:two-component system nitrate/nitrite sensor histidine kinase NarX
MDGPTERLMHADSSEPVVLEVVTPRAEGEEGLPPRLKLLGIALPILFIAGFVVLGYLDLTFDLVPADAHRWVIALLGIVAGACVIGFAHVMFRYLEKAHGQVVRQNQQLSAVTALVTAVQGQFDVEDVLRAAAPIILGATGASSLTYTVFTSDGEPHRDDSLDSRSTFVARGAPLLPESSTRAVDTHLSTGTASVGWLRLQEPTSRRQDRFARETLRALAHQLASAVQAAQLLADLRRRESEANALFDLLLQVTDRHATADILAAIVHHARAMLSTDQALLTLNGFGSHPMALAGPDNGPFGDGVTCIAAGDVTFHDPHGDDLICPIRSSGEWRAMLTVAIRDETSSYGDLWVARLDDHPFTRRERDYLEALARIAAIALSNVRARGSEHAAAVLSERERIAREMHDSLAQVLGATHLRLRVIDSHARSAGLTQVADDVSAVADSCQEAYRDVREAILGLHASSRSERGLVDGLRAYLGKYSHLSEIDATLETAPGVDEMNVSPEVEVQVIRVIQEALTNVRKHSGADHVVVRISLDHNGATFTVRDDGHGFDTDRAKPSRDGYGLYTMRERMTLIGGTLTIHSTPGQGTRVVAVVPASAPHHPRLAEVNGGFVRDAR